MPPPLTKRSGPRPRGRRPRPRAGGVRGRAPSATASSGWSRCAAAVPERDRRRRRSVPRRPSGPPARSRDGRRSPPRGCAPAPASAPASASGPMRATSALASHQPASTSIATGIREGPLPIVASIRSICGTQSTIRTGAVAALGGREARQLGDRRAVDRGVGDDDVLEPLPGAATAPRAACRRGSRRTIRRAQGSAAALRLSAPTSRRSGSAGRPPGRA